MVVESGFLGDVVLTAPIIAGIRKIYPEAWIVLLVTTKAKQVAELIEGISQVMEFDKRGEFSGIRGLMRFAEVIKKESFDIVYSLHKSYRTAILLFLSKIPHRIGFKQAQLSFLYNSLRDRQKGTLHEVEKKYSILKDEVLNSVDNAAPSQIKLIKPEITALSAHLEQLDFVRPYILVSPGSVWKTKQWSNLGYFKVVEKLLAKNNRVALVGGSNEAFSKEQLSQLEERYPELFIDLVDKTSIHDLAFLVSNTRLLICNDSFPLHLASAYQTPTLAIFCATSKEQGFGPWQNTKAHVLGREDLACRPCRRHGGRSCPTKTWLCVEGLSVAEVIRAVEGVLGGSII